MRIIALLLFLSFTSPALAETSIVVGGLTLHGFQNQNYVWEGMPRKLDDKGQMVFTPTVGIRWGEENLYTITLLKDCFDNYAGTFLWGRKVYESEYLNLEWSLGLYIRETPFYVAQNGKRYRAYDNIPGITAGEIQWLPIGFVGLELMPKWKVKPVINTNLVITNLSFKIEF